jgi:hypothetical protein
MHGGHRKAAGQHELAAFAPGASAGRNDSRDNLKQSWHGERVPGRKMLFSLLVLANLAAMPVPAQAQLIPDSENPSGTVTGTTRIQPGQPYIRPTPKARLHNYFFDAFGPTPILGSAIAAGISQEGNGIPEWGQGAEGYGKRFGSDLGIAAISTTTRFALSEALGQDAIYYRCECRGVFPRLGHALISTVTARRGADGHRVFSLPALVGPYAGTMTAVYAWYPNRYGAMDAFRMGNYNLLGYVGGNLALEFLYGGPHSLLSRMHLNDRHGAPNPDQNP